MLFILFITILLIFLTITIKVEFENIKINLPKIGGKILEEDNKILMKIYVLKKIKIFEKDLKKVKLDDQKIKSRLDKITRKNSELKTNINVLEIFLKDNYRIEKMNLNIYVGVEDAAITAVGVSIISSLISFFIRNKIENKQTYKVVPVYNANRLKVEFNGIFTLNIVNIINIINSLKKGRVKKNVRTSNRRTYAYSNE